MLLELDGTVFDFSAPGIVPDSGNIPVCGETGCRCNAVAPLCHKECPVRHQTPQFIGTQIVTGDDGPG